MPTPRFRLRTLMTVVVLVAIASALLAVIRTIDDREKPDAYKVVAGWAACASGLYALILYRGRRPRASAPHDRE